MVYCVNCGTELQNDWNVCPSCGTAKQQTFPFVSSENVENLDTDSKRKGKTTVEYREALFKNRSKGIAVFLSLLIPGAGHFYTDRWYTGMVYFFLFIILGPMLLVASDADALACSIIYIFYYIHVVVDSVSPV